MREDGGRIVLMDFGPDGGTPRYMAPELLLGEPPSPQTDLYALGVLLFHLATGGYPYPAESLEQLKHAHQAGQAQRLRTERPDLPPALVHAIDACLTPAAADRCRSAAELESALLRVTPPPAPVARSFHRRRGAALIAVAVIAVLLGIRFYQGEMGQRAAPITNPLIYTLNAAFCLGAQRIVLAENAIVGAGDSLSLVISSSESLYVYVVNVDASGRGWLLYPGEGLESMNPLTAREHHVLPGKTGAAYWQLTDPAGQEDLLLVTSPHRPEALEAELAALQRPEPGRRVTPRELSPEAMGSLRGFGGLSVADSSLSAAESARALFTVAEPLPPHPVELTGLRLFRIALQGPTH